MKARLWVGLIVVVLALGVGAAFAQSWQVTYLPLVSGEPPAQLEAESSATPTPCVIDWTLEPNTPNFLEILRCNRELHPPDGIIPLCPPTWSEWAYTLNVGICHTIVNGTAVTVTPPVTPRPYP